MFSFSFFGNGVFETFDVLKSLEVRMSLTPLDCTHKCRSLQHAQNIVAALTNGSDGQLRAFLSAYCHNSNILRDDFGRTSLHMVASLGKKALLEWLLENKYGDLTVKDKESGWTPLHRSAFYGHIHCLIPLVKVCFFFFKRASSGNLSFLSYDFCKIILQHGGLLSTQDKEGLSVLDLTMKDRPAHVVFKNTGKSHISSLLTVTSTWQSFAPVTEHVASHNIFVDVH